MTEDFIGKNGRLEEEFVAAANSSLKEVAFENFEARAVKEKPYLVEGLKKLKAAMGEDDFDKYINTAENINISGNSMLLLVAEEKVRTILLGKWLADIKNSFGVENLRIVGGARSGLDAY